MPYKCEIGEACPNLAVWFVREQGKLTRMCDECRKKAELLESNRSTIYEPLAVGGARMDDALEFTEQVGRDVVPARCAYLSEKEAIEKMKELLRSRRNTALGKPR
jgi:hypothetical protein